MALMVKNLPANSGDVRDAGLIPGSGRTPGGGNSYPLQYSCLGNSMDRGTWQARVHEVSKLDMTEHAHTRNTPKCLMSSSTDFHSLAPSHVVLVVEEHSIPI